MLSLSDLKKLVRAYGRKSSRGFSTVRYGIGAQCGSEERTIHLEPGNLVESEGLAGVDMWHLYSKIVTSVFGNEDSLERQPSTAGAESAIDPSILAALRSGRYDAGLSAACRKCELPSFAAITSDVMQGEAPKPAVVLLTPAAGVFATFHEPLYSQLALTARIQGRVEVDVFGDAATGVLTSATMISGHPLLRQAVKDVIQQWRLKPGMVSPTTPTRIALDFQAPNPCH